MRKKVYLAFQACLYGICAALLCLVVLRIYRDGLQRQSENVLLWIFTRENVAEGLRPVLPVLYGTLGSTLAGLLLNLRDEGMDREVRDTEIQRDLLSRGREATPEILRERKLQRIFRILGICLFLLCLAMVTLFRLREGGEAEADFLRFLNWMLPWTAGGFLCLMITEGLRAGSISRETEALRKQPRVSSGPEKPMAETGKGRGLVLVRLLILLLALCLILAGILNGGMRDTLMKAILICTECVGLG